MNENASNKASYEQYLRTLYSDNSDLLIRFRSQFFRAVQQELTPRQHDALLLHYLKGETQRQIASRWNVNPSVVSRHISRAKRKLKKLLEYNLYFKEDKQ